MDHGRMLQTVFRAFGLSSDTGKAVAFGSGLINNTWKIEEGNNTYILQRINNTVFKQPDAIAHNIAVTGQYLRQQHPGYLFVQPEKSVYGKDYFFDEQYGWFRLLPFIKNSHTVDVVQDPRLAFEAAGQFGKFTRLLCGFDAARLKITLPDFHNLSLRYLQFENAVINGNKKRILQAEKLVHFLTTNKNIAEQYQYIKANPRFKLRVTHHDTKISNVLFDDAGKGLCVIDLDTLMPGYFISDAGDMMRTYLSPVSEEESDFSKIGIREEYFAAIVSGYLGQLNDELTSEEKNSFVYAGKCMIYMQALRFLTDYLNNDVYYGAMYDGHNFVRAGNQAILLQKLMEKETVLRQIVAGY